MLSYDKIILDINRKIIKKETLLIYLIYVDDFDLIKKITSNENINKKDKNGLTSLMYACACGNYRVSNFFIKNKANINDKNKDGITPLMFAAMEGHKSIVKLLLRNNASIDSVDNCGLNAITYAQKYRWKCIANLLIRTLNWRIR